MNPDARVEELDDWDLVCQHLPAGWQEQAHHLGALRRARGFPGAGFHRSDLQEYLDSVGIDSRTIWTGNVTRQPMMKGVEYRQPAGGLPNCDRVMESGTILSCSHGMTEEELEYTTGQIEKFLAKKKG